MCSERTERPPEATPQAEPRAIDRRGFLKLSGIGLLGVALFCSVEAGVVFAQSEPPAQSRPPVGSALAAEFTEAAEEYGVPMELLMAMGYVNTRWEMPPPETNAYRRGDLHGWGSYGIMALVQNPYSDTLGEASRLMGIPEEELKTNRAANIWGGAALLAKSAGGYTSGNPSDFYGAVAGRGLAAGQPYAAVSGVGGGELYAEQVFEVLRTGASKTISSGEMVALALHVPPYGIRGPYGW
jgi:hypothetical protein